MLKKIINNFGSRLLSALLNLVVAIVASQYLGASGKGDQTIILTTISIIVIFCSFIGASSFVYMVPRYKLSALYIPSIVWTVFSGCVLGFVLYFVKIIPSCFVIHVILLSVVSTIGSINSSILIAKEEINKYNILTLIQTSILLLSFLLWILVFKNISIYSYIYALYISYLSSFLISFILTRKYFYPFCLEKISVYAIVTKEFAKLGLFNQIAHITQILSLRANYYFLENISGKDQLGIYSNGVSLSESIWLISSSIALVQYSRIVNSRDKLQNLLLTNKFHKLSLLMCLGAIIPLVLLPSVFYTTIFGAEFGQVNKVIWTLAPGILAYNSSLILCHYFSGTGRYYINAIVSSIGLLATIVFSLVLVPKFHLYGAGITASLSFIVTAIAAAFFFWKDDKPNFKHIFISVSDYRSFRDILNKYNSVSDFAKSLIVNYLKK